MREEAPVRRIAAALLLLLLVGAAAGCGDSRAGGAGGGATRPAPPSPVSSTSPYQQPEPPAFNRSDVRFVEELRRSRRQALALSDRAAARAASREVRQLAVGLKAACLGDIQELTGWLREHGRPQPGTGPEVQLATLDHLAGPRFDQAFLSAMLRNQQEAIQIANQARARAAAGQILQVAVRVTASGTAMIVELRRLMQRR